jgi:penicillin amidase
VVAGSNGRVAWGLTNANADCADVVPVPLSAEEGFYHGPGNSGLVEFETHRESIRVHGAKAEIQEYPWTVWGPVIGKDSDGRPLAYRWTALSPSAINFRLLDMETAATTQEAIGVAHSLGIPAQNVLIADASGQIAWTIGGSLPNRVGFDGRLPVSWIYGDRRWEGFVPSERIPVFDPPGQAYLWTANQRMVGVPQIATLGDGGYGRPARAAQIRDDLAELVGHKPKSVAPADLLAIELDDRARSLDRWRDLMLRTLSGAKAAPGSERAELAAAVRGGELRADIDSTAYRLVRDFRIAACRLVLGPIFAPCTEAYPEFQAGRLDIEGAVWTLLEEQPPHLLNPRFAQWSDLLVAAADQVGADLSREGLRPSQAIWGRRNRLNIRHVFGQMLPEWLTSWLNMPVVPIPGGDDMPRIQDTAFGASERFAVEPGHEEQGIYEMPCGESGHPLSPYYRAGHENWVRGAPSPFLPGATEHTLTLQP